MTGDDADRDILDKLRPTSAFRRKMSSPFDEIHVCSRPSFEAMEAVLVVRKIML